MLNEPGPVVAALNSAFPQRFSEGAVAPHECEECVAIRSGLAGRTWGEVPDEFAEEFCDGLPLLSPDAYNAYLPVWLRAAVRDPGGKAAMMVGINLSDNPIRSASQLRRQQRLWPPSSTSPSTMHGAQTILGM